MAAERKEEEGRKVKVGSREIPLEGQKGEDLVRVWRDFLLRGKNFFDCCLMLLLFARPPLVSFTLVFITALNYSED